MDVQNDNELKIILVGGQLAPEWTETSPMRALVWSDGMVLAAGYVESPLGAEIEFGVL